MKFMTTDDNLNFGFMAIRFYIGKFPSLNLIDPQAILGNEDSQGGYLFDFEGDRYFIHMTNLNEFEVICVNKFNELTIIHLPDAEDLLVFFGSLVNGDKIYL